MYVRQAIDTENRKQQRKTTDDEVRLTATFAFRSKLKFQPFHWWVNRTWLLNSLHYVLSDR